MDQAIDELQRRSAADPNVIGLGGGLPSEAQFPKRAMSLAFIRAVQRPVGEALQYGWPEGIPSLRSRIAERLRERGASVGPDDVLITSGGQQAIALAVQLTTQAGDEIAVDAESYPAALDLFRARSLRPVTGPAAPGSARVAYVMPEVSNPRGTAMDDRARSDLLATRRILIEDDAYAEVGFAGPPRRPLLADAPDRVYHVGTYSKVLCPGLRVGWLVPPSAERDRAIALKRDADLQSSSLTQAILDEFFERQALEPWAERLRRFYRRRASLMGAAVRRHWRQARFARPAGGFALWVELPGEVDETTFLRAAIDHGVTFDPGSMFRVDAAPLPLAVRLCFSFVGAPQFDEGVRRLAAAYGQVAERAR